MFIQTASLFDLPSSRTIRALLAGGGDRGRAGARVPRPGAGANPAPASGGGGPAGRAWILGPAGGGPDRPDLSRLTVIRFLTETDYPPFNFTGARRQIRPASTSIWARAICDEIKVTCTIQMRRFRNPGRCDHHQPRAMPSLLPWRLTPQMRAKVDFSDPYYRAPARFVSRRDGRDCRRFGPEYLEGKKVGAIVGTSHEAYLKAMFTDAEIKSYANDDALRQAFAGAARSIFIFGDAIAPGVLDQRHGLRRMLRLLGRAVCRKPFFFRRRHRHRRAQGQRSAAAVAEPGRCSGCGKKARYTDLWLRYFSISPFLGVEIFVGWAKARRAVPTISRAETRWWARFALPTL